MQKPDDGLQRVVIEDVTPQLDGGRHPVRRVAGDKVTVTAAVFADGHDQLAARVLYRPSGEQSWHLAPMLAMGNDLWSASFVVDRLGEWKFSVEGWMDRFESWAGDLRKRIAAQMEPALVNKSGGSLVVPTDISIALEVGAGLLRQGGERASGIDAEKLFEAARRLGLLAAKGGKLGEYPLDEAIHQMMAGIPICAT